MTSGRVDEQDDPTASRRADRGAAGDGRAAGGARAPAAGARRGRGARQEPLGAVPARGRRARQRPQAGAARHRGGQPLRPGEVRRGAAAGPGQPGAGGAERRPGDRRPQPQARARRRRCSCSPRRWRSSGSRPIDPVGEPFDPARHEAMLAQDSATAEPNSVLQVVQPGYELNGRLLRPARVIVAKAPGLRRAIWPTARLNAARTPKKCI